MKQALHFIIDKLNHIPLWRREVCVWNTKMWAPTFDRWLYLNLNKIGLMGREDKITLENYIRPGMSVLDIGANIGVFTLLLSRLVGNSGRVISFEPDPELFYALKRNCELNSAYNVQLHNVALGSVTGSQILNKSLINSGDNRLSAWGNGSLQKTALVKVAKLDDLLPSLKIDFVKIDVQGWELEVFKGMQLTLHNNPKANIYFEFWPRGIRGSGGDPIQLLNLFEKRSMKIWAFNNGTGERVTDFNVFNASVKHNRYVNLLVK